MKRINKPSERHLKSFREKTRLARKHRLDERKGTGYWLNDSLKYDPDYQFDGYQKIINIIADDCNIPKREDSLEIFKILISNLLRYRDIKPIEIALSKSDTISKYTKVLEDNKMIEAKRGNAKMARYSRIYPTNKLLDLFDPVHSLGIIVNPSYDRLVILKDEDKREIKYKDTDTTRRIKKILKHTNSINKSAKILLNGKPLSTALIAIFHKNFTCYGRLHTKGCYHYQGISGTKREMITINGESVVELDYSGLHPRLLYASEGIMFDDDPYSIISDNPKLRDFLKTCLLVMLNATSSKVPGKWIEATKKNKRYYRKGYTASARGNAEASINRTIGYDKKLKVELEESDIKARGEEILAKDIISLFEKLHEEIAHHFFSDNDNGLKTMNKDARMALDIVKHFTQKEIPILAIHDSFLVQKKYEEELYDVMDSTYRRLNGGFSCPIK